MLLILKAHFYKFKKFDLGLSHGTDRLFRSGRDDDAFAQVLLDQFVVESQEIGEAAPDLVGAVLIALHSGHNTDQLVDDIGVHAVAALLELRDAHAHRIVGLLK